MKRLLIIDSHALLHRAYHALPPLTNHKGEPIGALYGFASILLNVVSQIKPDYIIACFDLAKPTIRHKKFADYKATRPKVPDELIKQFHSSKEFLRRLDVPILEKEGYEADDAIGTVVKKISQKYKNVENMVLTGDLDTLQLINQQTKIFTPRRGLSDPVIYDLALLKKRYKGLLPNQVPDYKGLKGDPSDNIPGVPGVGEKTALKLISRFKTLEGLYKVIENDKKLKELKKEKFISPSIIKKLKENKDQAFFSRELATIYCDIPISFKLKNAAWNPNPAHIEQILSKSGFPSLVRRYQTISQGKEVPFRSAKNKLNKKKEKNNKTKQNSLF